YSLAAAACRRSQAMRRSIALETLHINTDLLAHFAVYSVPNFTKRRRISFAGKSDRRQDNQFHTGTPLLVRTFWGQFRGFRAIVILCFSLRIRRPPDRDFLAFQLKRFPNLSSVRSRIKPARTFPFAAKCSRAETTHWAQVRFWGSPGFRSASCSFRTLVM